MALVWVFLVSPAPTAELPGAAIPVAVPGGHGLRLSDAQHQWLQAHPVIRVGVDPDYAPYDWIDERGEPVGMSVDYLRLLQGRLGIRFDIVQGRSWEQILEMARRGDVEMLTSIVQTSERQKYLAFSQPYRDVQTIIVDAGRGGFIGNLSRLVGRRVAVERGYFTQELLARDHPDIRQVPADSTLEALKLVLGGQADAYVGDIGTANYAIQRHGLRSLRFSGQTDDLTQHRFGVTLANAPLVAIIDSAMASVSKDESDAIFNRWIGLRIEPGIRLQTLLGYLPALTGLLLLFGFWVVRLRREIHDRRAAEQREHARNAILEMMAQGTPVSEVLRAIVLNVEREHPAMLCSVLLLSSDRHHLGQVVAPSLPAFYNEAIEGIAIGVGAGACGTAAVTGELVAVADIASHPYFVDYRELAARAGLAACWSQPIRSSTREILGTFAIYHRSRHVPTQTDLVVIALAARLASISIESGQAAQQLQASEALYRLLAEEASDVIWRTDRELRITYISPADERVRGYRADEVIGRSALELFTDEGAALVRQRVEKVLAAPVTPGAPLPGPFEVQCRLKGGGWMWGEMLGRPERDAQGNVIGFHGITRDISERRRMQEQVRQLAFYDPLTGLANRRMLDDRIGFVLAACQRYGAQGALMVLDLDNFKALNDAHGHAVGDLLLIEVARRLGASVRAIDTVARFGGDEFVVLLGELDAEAGAAHTQAAMVAEKVRAALALPYRLSVVQPGAPDQWVEHRCSASMGVQVFDGAQRTAADILQRADSAMYQAKEAGRNCVRFAGPLP